MAAEPVAGQDGASADPPWIALSNATVIDGTGAGPRPRTTILIQGSGIVDVFADGSRSLPEGTLVEDLNGQFVIPGLIDAHSHVYLRPYAEHVENLRGLLLGGVTSIRDPAGDARITAFLARQVTTGEIVGPDIFFAALMGGPGFSSYDAVVAASAGWEPGTAPWVREVTDTSDVPRVIADARATGATGVKLYRYLPPHLTRSLAAEARRQGLEVWSHVRIRGHTGTGEPWSSPSQVVGAGAQVLSHASDFACEVMRCASGAERSLAVATVDPRHPAIMAVLRAMAEDSVVLDATLSVDADKPEPHWLRFSGAVTRIANELGVPVVTGTDTPEMLSDGFPALHHELELLVRHAGLTPAEALVAATRTAAATIGQTGSRGTLTPGKRADLVVLERDPTVDISHTRSIKWVMQAGRRVH